MTVVAGAAALWCAAPVAVTNAVVAGVARAAGAVVREGAWRAAMEVPGTGALNKGGNAGIGSMSCSSAGDCAAGGSYTDGAGHQQAFVVSEWHGAWRRAIEVPGTGVLNKGGEADVAPVSCTSAGTCGAGGQYRDRAGRYQAFVASERGGVRLNRDGGAMVGSVSCVSAGNCGAGGWYVDRSGNEQAFVVSERAGVWRPAIELPGTGALNKGGAAAVDSVSCVSAGRCAANGYYVDGSWNQQAFVAG